MLRFSNVRFFLSTPYKSAKCRREEKKHRQMKSREEAIDNKEKQLQVEALHEDIYIDDNAAVKKKYTSKILR